VSQLIKEVKNGEKSRECNEKGLETNQAPGDVAKMIGADSKEVSKVISELKKKGKVISPKRCYYALNK